MAQRARRTQGRKGLDALHRSAPAKPHRRLPSLNALRAFEAAARHLNFSRAAGELNVTQGAISRQIKLLENFLGIVLFRRLPRSIELTAEGKQYLVPLHQAFELMYRATESILDGRRIVTLNVSVLPTLAMRWLIPRLPAFAAAHPTIEVRLNTSIRPVDFGLDDNDVAIRVGPPSLERRKGERSPIDLVMTHDWADVRAIPLLPDQLVVVCSPGLRDGTSPLRKPSDLQFHTLLHTATREKAWPFWLRTVGADDLALPPAKFAYGHFFMTVQAAVEGRGVAIVPRVLVESELASGSLVTPFDAPPLTTGTYYLLGRASQWNTSKVRRFREWILREVGQSAVSGRAGSEASPGRKGRAAKDGG